MPRYLGDYKGVSYIIDTGHHPAGWTWRLRIGGDFAQSQGRPLETEEIAIVQAEEEVEARVNRGVGK